MKRVRDACVQTLSQFGLFNSNQTTPTVEQALGRWEINVVEEERQIRKRRKIAQGEGGTLTVEAILSEPPLLKRQDQSEALSTNKWINDQVDQWISRHPFRQNLNQPLAQKQKQLRL
jgi:hypothetical protein